MLKTELTLCFQRLIHLREKQYLLYSSFTVWFKLDQPQSNFNHLTELWVNLNELRNSNNSIGLMYGKTVTDN